MVATPEIPELQMRALREAAALAASPSVQAAQQAIARLNAEHQAQIRMTIAPIARLQENWARYVQDVIAPAEEARRAIVRQAATQWGESFRAFYAVYAQQQLDLSRALARASLSFDTTGLDRMLRDMEAWRRLAEEQRAAAVSVVEEAYETTDERDVPEDLVAGLQGTVRDFAAAEAEYLPIEVQRRAFTLFVGTVVLLLLMQLSFTNDTAEAVMSTALEVGPVAGMAMLAAGKAWDRYSGDAQGGDEAEQEN